jgi:hypothetical protein
MSRNLVSRMVEGSGFERAYRFCLQGVTSTIPWFVPPDHLLLDSAPNLGPLISRWEINQFENCWYKSVTILEVLKLLFQQFLNLSSSQRDMSGAILGALSNNRWSWGTSLEFTVECGHCLTDTNFATAAAVPHPCMLHPWLTFHSIPPRAYAFTSSIPTFFQADLRRDCATTLVISLRRRWYRVGRATTRNAEKTD